MSRLGTTYQPPKPSTPAPPEDEGFDMGVLGRMLSGAGNAIDLPGSMVRDAVSFSNPFDQIMTPFSPENRTSGAEISRYWMGGDENSGGNQLAGMIIDILSDPLMIASGGTLAAGKMGAKAASTAMKGAKGVGKAAKGAYDTAKAATPKARMAKSLTPYVDDYTQATDRAAKLSARMQEGQRVQQMNDAAYLGMPGAPRVSGLDELGTATDAAIARAQSAQEALARRQAGFDRFAEANRIPIAMAQAQPFVSGAQAGARQLGQSMYGGVRGAIGGAVDATKGLAGRTLAGDRNALMQSGAIAGNMANTFGGLHRSEQPPIEDLIAQAIMEDPELGSQLMELLGVGQPQF